jgi:hypothetical protein
MTTTIFKGAALFFLLLVVTSVLMDTTQMNFGNVDFFQRHGVFFLFFITIAPRLTLLISSVATGGLIWWLGFIFCPRVLVASLATVGYFHTNPLLVIISWFVAFGGEIFEKKGLTGKNRFVFRTYNMGHRPPPVNDFEEPKPTVLKGDAIEAEFKKEE